MPVEGSRKRKQCSTEIVAVKKPKLGEVTSDGDTDSSIKQKKTRSLRVISKYVQLFWINVCMYTSTLKVLLVKDCVTKMST